MESPLQDDDPVHGQDGHAEAVELLEARIGIDIHHLHGGIQALSREKFLGNFAEMAAAARVKQKSHKCGSISGSEGLVSRQRTVQGLFWKVLGCWGPPRRIPPPYPIPVRSPELTAA